jgi:hypothetical protein
MSDWSSRLTGVRALLADKLGATGDDFGRQVRRAGRRLPRRVRREAEFLVRAEEMARHPKFARLIDPRAVARAEGRLSRHLRRKDGVALVALYVLVTFALVVTLLWWRGIV